MIMFSAFSNSITLYLFGNLFLGYALWVGFLSSCGIVFSLYVVNEIVKKYKRPSIIVFMLGGVIAASSITLPYYNA